ncbi:MAG: SPOR domain-containing protein [Pseudomonadota bacterium]|nr:SPOR domain-containing protein [Pseudomonadota bacterium]
MLRVLVLALLLANAVYLVWAQGLLGVYGFGPVSQAEPERLAQQIRPEAIQLLGVATAPQPPAMPLNTTAPPPAPAAATPGNEPAPAAATAPVVAASATPAPVAAAPLGVPLALPLAVPAPAPALAQCLQAGLFTERQANAMRPRLQARLPPGSWSFEGTGEPIRWMVYMGKYISREAMNRKRVLLDQVGVPYQIPVSPLLNPGLSLGSYNTRAEAEAAWSQFAERGIRSARVVLERPEVPTQWLRLPAVDAALQAKVSTFIPQLSGKPLQACSQP